MATNARNRTIVWIVVAIAVLANIAGYVLDYYQRFWWYDDFLHGYTLFAITLALGLYLYARVLTGVRERSMLLIITIAGLGIAIGGLWEIAEWGYDLAVPTDAILGKMDTIGDLIMDTIGSLLAAFVCLAMIRE